MTGLLELRERIKLIYSKFEAFILPVVKFVLAFVVLNTLNSRMGYMTRLDNATIVLIVALMCSFLPTGAIVLFGAAFSLMHMYALSLEVLLVGFCIYLVMFLLFLRFTPRESLVVALTPLLIMWKIPYVIPIALGLLCSPASAVSAGCGIGVYYLLQTVNNNASTIRTMGEDDATAKVRLIIDGLIGNKGMVVVIAAFAVTIIVVYLIRRMSIDYSWTIAMVAGAMTDIVILLIGDLLYDINISVTGALLGSLLALVVAKIIEFFRFCVDYSRTEKVQFEDDEYYYYVKAVPKMSVAMSTRTVKKINSQSGRGNAAGASGKSAAGAAGAGRAETAGTGAKRPAGRSVTTERTASGRGAGYGAGTSPRPTQAPRKSVTIGSAAAADADSQDDYEELF